MFSAFDITTTLRTANPNLEIAHDRVRPLVHGAMGQAIVAGLYEAQHGAFIAYVPVTAAPPIPAPQAPAQSATAPTTTTGDTAQLSGIPLLPLSGGN